MRVALLFPIVKDGTQFYDLAADIMRVAAAQLDIELEVIEGTHDPAVFLQRGVELAGRATRFDYVILANNMSAAPELIPLFDKAGVRTLLVTEGLSGSDRLALRRRSCARFLGEIVPDDVDGGRMLAEALVTEARRLHLHGPDGKVHVGMLAGMQTIVNNLRFMGFSAFKEREHDVVHSGLDFGGWNEVEAADAAKQLLGRAPETTVLWCFNDVVSLGAAEAAAAMGRKPGKDLLIGGFDLLDGALASIMKGTIHVSVGGHVVDGVRALLLLHDRERNDATTVAQTTHMEAVKRDEAAQLQGYMRERGWRSSDFTRFSARRNPGPRPELSLRALVKG